VKTVLKFSSDNAAWLAKACSSFFSLESKLLRRRKRQQHPQPLCVAALIGTKTALVATALPTGGAVSPAGSARTTAVTRLSRAEE